MVVIAPAVPVCGIRATNAHIRRAKLGGFLFYYFDVFRTLAQIFIEAKKIPIVYNYIPSPRNPEPISSWLPGLDSNQGDVIQSHVSYFTPPDLLLFLPKAAGLGFEPR